MTQPWFEVDPKGLRQLQERRGLECLVYELVQNAWDQDTETVEVTTQHESRRLTLTVTDHDPHGFVDITHAYTLFAESTKRGNAEKRGRFNLGEKLVLSRCRRAEVISTTKAIRFDDRGRHHIAARTKEGTRFTAEMPATKAEYSSLLANLSRLIPPSNILTSIDGQILTAPTKLGSTKTKLLTEIADDTGVLRRTQRTTTVDFFLPMAGQEPFLYEMGIPVCASGGKYHYQVNQKVPLGLERDSVNPAYLDQLHLVAFNQLYSYLEVADILSPWVRRAQEMPNASPAAVVHFMDLKFGARRVIYDSSDPEANKLAMSAGYTIVTGNMLSKDGWANAKEAKSILPAGQVTPSPKPYSPDGPPLNLLSATAITADMRRIEALAQQLARELLNINLTVHWANEPNWGVRATYGNGSPLVLNAPGLGNTWCTCLDDRASEEVLSLLIHEFGHHYESDHLSRGYYQALTSLGARLALRAAIKPELLHYQKSQ